MRISLTALFLLLGVLLTTSAGLCAEEILSYDVDITVNKDSSLLIDERITVRAEGREIRRGIYRDFPTDYKTSSGKRVRVGFSVEYVDRDGNPEKYHTERRGNGVRVYIGDKNKFVSHGVHTYHLRFKTNRQLGFFDSHDELYFNAIGHGWIFPIKQASVTIQLPDSIPSREINLDGFTGRQGAVDKNFSARISPGNIVRYNLTRSLAPYEGATVLVMWPKGHVEQPSAASNFFGQFFENIGAFFAGLLTLLASFVHYFIWRKEGVDPPKGVIYPRFEAPDGMAAYELPFLQKMGYQPRCLSSVLISSAIKKVLEIKEEDGFMGFGKKLTLRRLSRDTADLDSLEAKTLTHVFGGYDEIECDDKNYRNFQAAQRAISRELKSKLGKNFSLNYFHALPGILIFVAAFGIANFLGYDGMLGLILLVGVPVSIFFLAIMKRYSKEGRKLLDEIEGYKLYLETAEKGHYDKVIYPELNTIRFEKHLPYAVALGCEAKWMKAFEKALVAAGQAPGSYHPDYYRSDGRFGDSSIFRSGGFTRSIASSSSPPGSSSGSSGGSSGGGGGGGGGGGW